MHVDKCVCGHKPQLVQMQTGKVRYMCENPECPYKPCTCEYFNETYCAKAWNDEVKRCCEIQRERGGNEQISLY